MTTEKRCEDTTSTWEPFPEYCVWGEEEPRHPGELRWGWSEECSSDE